MFDIINHCMKEKCKDKKYDIPMKDTPIKPTPTERAFDKARQLDIIVGYIYTELRKSGLFGFKSASMELRLRYRIETGSDVDMILWFIEDLIEKNKKKHI